MTTDTFERQVRTDFTLDELKEAAVSGQTSVVDYVKNDNYDAEYAAWREETNSVKRGTDEWREVYSRQPKYYQTDENGNFVIASEELLDMEDADEFWSEGGYLHGFGNFVDVEGTYFNNGDGHDMGQVWEHVESGRLFLAVGTYSSWNGSDWDSSEVVEVKPVQVTVTRFADVNSDKIYTDPTVDIK